MSIVKMKKLRMVALNQDRSSLMECLQKQGCVEIMQFPAPEGLVSAVSYNDNEKRLKELRHKRSNADAALKALKKNAYVKSGLFSNRDLISEADFFSESVWSSAERTVANILDAEASLNSFRGEEFAVTAQINSLLLWKDVSVPFELDRTQSSRIMLGSIPSTRETDDFSEALTAASEQVYVCAAGRDRDKKGVVLICSADCVDDIRPVLRSYEFEPAPVAGHSGTAAENIEAAKLRLEEIRSSITEVLNYFVKYGEFRREIKLYYDRLTMDIDMAEADGKLLNTDSAFALSGWVSEPDVPALEALLGSYCCAYELSQPEPEDKVPIRLKNNKLTEPLNMVTEMYSLPAYNGIDPNPLITPFFCVFFGMMFNDLGYGLVFIIASLIIKNKCRLRGTMKYIVGLMLLCGITTAAMGIITGSFFGDSITVIAAMFGKTVALPSLLNPMDDPMKVLIISIILGGIHILFGMGINAYMLIRDGHPLDALFDVGSWWLLFAGIALLATGHGAWLLFAGLAALVLTQGRSKPTFIGKLIGGVASLYDITSYLSDVLSYSRIMALMLAGGIVASIVNILGSLPGTIILFIPIFIFGHVFNIGINVIGTYVHAARLQYLEFFGKFYRDGGKAFRPLGIKTKYFDIIKNDSVRN